MTIEQLSQQNEKFQQRAAEIAELVPGSNLLEYSSILIRSSKKLDRILKNLLQANTEARFFQQVDAMEEEMDEIIWFLDQMDLENRKSKLGTINDFVKKGYELLSIYSLSCDRIIERRTKKEDELE